MGKISSCKAGDTGDVGSIPELGRSPGGGKGYPLQCSCLENSMNRETWQTTVQRVAKSRTQLRDRTELNSSGVKLEEARSVVVVVVDSLSHVRPHGPQAPLSMGFFRQEYWSRLPFPSPGDLPNSGIEPTFPVLCCRLILYLLSHLGSPLEKG